MDADWLPFGLLGRAHGVAGEVLLRPYAAESRSLDALALPLPTVASQGGRAQPLSLVALRRVPDGLLVRFEGIATRDEARVLTGQELRLPRSALPPLGPGEFYVEDLLGCTVMDTQGRDRGVVSGLFWNGAQDVMVIRSEGQEEDALVPVVAEFIQGLDRMASRVLVDFHD